MNAPIPHFEGRPVDAVAMKMSGAVPMESIDDVVVSIDDVVQLLAQYRCVGVQHKEDANGNLIRVQVLRPMGMELQPITPGVDNGVIRSLPTTSGTVVVQDEDDE